MALNLEICDYVNTKQGSAPREAAIAVAKLVNHSQSQVAELAIALLDNLVKNCGYPFHLQISRKEFLNELVKRFPERPPLRYSRIHRLILSQIEEWYQTICRTSKYKEDFVYIRDMRRLLSNKGYIFPEVKVEDAAVLNPSDKLKSLEEIRKEEALVHSAKLQELVRRGRPQDLQEANKLMKIMAGFKDDNLEENRKQVSDDVSRLKRKAVILGEMLNSVQQSGGRVDDSNEAIIELYSSLKSSQPIVSKIMEEEEEESQLNDLHSLKNEIDYLSQKYLLLRNGKIEEADQVKVKGASSAQSDVANLIDFDDDVPLTEDKSGKDEEGFKDLLLDLSTLTFTDTGNSNANLFGAGGSISLQSAPVTSKKGISEPNNDSLLLGLSPQNTEYQKATGSNNRQLDPFGFAFPTSTPTSVQNTQVTSDLKVLNESSNVKVEVRFSASSTPDQCDGEFLFSNLQPNTLHNFKFMLAVPKNCQLSLSPQSGDLIYGMAQRSLTQAFLIVNTLSKPLKVKWKAEYNITGQHQEETGVSQLN